MIVLDPRVGKKGNQSAQDRLDAMVKTLRRRVSCKVTVAKPRLESGDVAFEGNGPDGIMDIGIELKTIGDLCGSMRADKLAGDQLVKMSKTYGVIFVIVQGLWKPSDRDILMTIRGREWKPLNLAPSKTERLLCFHYSEPFKHIVSLSVLKNVIVLRSMNEDETLWQIAHLYNWWQKPWDQHRSADPVKVQSDNLFVKNSEIRTFAHDLPGIGWERSKAVEKAFGSVFRAVNASVEQWEEVEGIGPKMAQTIWKWIRRNAV